MTVCLVSSGTGGHLTPALALGQELRAFGHRPVLVSEGRGVEGSLLENSWLGEPGGAGGGHLTLGRFRGRGLKGRLLLPFRLAGATAKAVRMLRREKVQLVVSTGGSTAVPVAWAARLLGIPVCLLEQNAVTGRAHQLLARGAKRIYLGLPGDSQRSQMSKDSRLVHTGTPLREGFGLRWRDVSRRELGLQPQMPTVLVVGGSQGARYLNHTVPRALAAAALPGGLQVFHLAGRGNGAEVEAAYKAVQCADGLPRVTAQVMEFCGAMPAALGAADLVVCRGGGSTLAEILAVGRPAVVVPYPHHKDMHQRANGEVLARGGAGMVVDQTVTDGGALGRVLGDLLRDANRLEAMAMAAERMAPERAAGRVVQDLMRSGLLTGPAVGRASPDGAVAAGTASAGIEGIPASTMARAVDPAATLAAKVAQSRGSQRPPVKGVGPGALGEDFGPGVMD